MVVDSSLEDDDDHEDMANGQTDGMHSLNKVQFERESISTSRNESRSPFRQRSQSSRFNYKSFPSPKQTSRQRLLKRFLLFLSLALLCFLALFMALFARNLSLAYDFPAFHSSNGSKWSTFVGNTKDLVRLVDPGGSTSFWMMITLVFALILYFIWFAQNNGTGSGGGDEQQHRQSLVDGEDSEVNVEGGQGPPNQPSADRTSIKWIPYQSKVKQIWKYTTKRLAQGYKQFEHFYRRHRPGHNPPSSSSSKQTNQSNSELKRGSTRTQASKRSTPLKSAPYQPLRNEDLFKLRAMMRHQKAVMMGDSSSAAVAKSNVSMMASLVASDDGCTKIG